MAWQVINLSLHLSSSEERKIQRGKDRRKEEEEEESERGRGLGLNHTTGPWSPSWSFKWSKAKRSKCWIYKSSLICRRLFRLNWPWLFCSGFRRYVRHDFKHKAAAFLFLSRFKVLILKNFMNLNFLSTHIVVFIGSGRVRHSHAGFKSPLHARASHRKWCMHFILCNWYQPWSFSAGSLYTTSEVYQAAGNIEHPTAAALH